MKINICFSTDNNYIHHLARTLCSILSNADRTDTFDIFVLENDVSESNKNKLLKEFNSSTCRINFVNISTKFFNDFPDYKFCPHITKMGYSRLLIADLLKDVDKIIYLDCDTIVLSSLKELFETNLDGYYIAAAEDTGQIFNSKFYGSFYKQFNPYVNSGVLLINLEYWRKNNILPELTDSIKQNKENFMFGDQDAINFVFKGKIKIIDFFYNFQTCAFNIKHLLPSDIKLALKNTQKTPKIIHYSTNNKPWNSYTYLNKYYLKYERLNPFGTESFFKLKFKSFKYFVYHVIFKVCSLCRHLLSPILDCRKKDEYIQITIFKAVKFNLLKYK